jgi:hypothetical protein
VLLKRPGGEVCIILVSICHYDPELLTQCIQKLAKINDGEQMRFSRVWPFAIKRMETHGILARCDIYIYIYTSIYCYIMRIAS